MDSGHSILNFKTKCWCWVPGREAGIAGQGAQSCGSWMLLWTCWVPVNVPLRVAFFFFPLGQGSSGSLRPRSSMWQFSAIWRIFTAASLKTLCQQLPSSVAPTCHELFILLCMPLQPPEGQEGEGQPAQCLPCGHAGSHTRKGIFFCPNCLDHSLHQGQLYHECMLQDTLHDRVPFQYHVIWLWTKARPSLSFLQPEVQPRLWRTGWELHQFVVSSPLSNFGTAGAGAYLQKKFQLGTKRIKPSSGSELISILKLLLL